MTKQKPIDREFRPLPKLADLTDQELFDLDSHIVRRATAWAEIDNIRKQRGTSSTSTSSSPAPLDRLKMKMEMFDAGLISEKEYFFFRSIHAERVDGERHSDGQYDEAFAAINAKMRDIEKAHGLSDDQYWLKCDAPEDWLALAHEYEAIADQKFEQVLSDLDFPDLLKYYKEDKNEFNRLREAGRRSVFDEGDTELAVVGLILDYEGQAKKAAKGQAYFAAGTMLCAAMEARLLHQVLSHIDDAKSAASSIRTSGSSSRKISENPLRWTFDDLLQVSHVAGWIDTIETENTHCSLYGWLSAQKELRNYIHPGNNARKSPHILPEKEAYEDALQAYNGLRLALAKLEASKVAK